MADSPNGIGSSRVGGGMGTLARALGLGPVSRAQADAAQRPGADGARPNGPAGQRMLSADTPVDELDHGARRGTYLDILV